MGTERTQIKHVVLTNESLSYLIKLLSEHEKNLNRLSSFYSQAERDQVAIILRVLEPNGI